MPSACNVWIVTNGNLDTGCVAHAHPSARAGKGWVRKFRPIGQVPGGKVPGGKVPGGVSVQLETKGSETLGVGVCVHARVCLRTSVDTARHLRTSEDSICLLSEDIARHLSTSGDSVSYLRTSRQDLAGLFLTSEDIVRHRSASEDSVSYLRTSQDLAGLRLTSEDIDRTGRISQD